MKIMLLEDNTDMQQVLASVLELNGHEVIAGYNGQDGLRLLEQWIPDVIISDMRMPVMDGLTFLQHVQIDNRWSHIPEIENFNALLQQLQG
jgi:CheY-like chemotaxis protein